MTDHSPEQFGFETPPEITGPVQTMVEVVSDITSKLRMPTVPEMLGGVLVLTALEESSRGRFVRAGAQALVAAKIFRGYGGAAK